VGIMPMLRIRLALIVFLGVCAFSGRASAQDAVPVEILERTVMIRTATEQGTAFALDYEGHLYFVTARHMVTGLPKDHPSFQIRRMGQWQPETALKILFPKSDEVDIAVFKTDSVVQTPYMIQPMENDPGKGFTMGQLVWFLGYPFFEGLGTHTTLNGNPVELPFIKRATLSASDGSNPDAVLLYLDGFNNEGFSGGPILFWSFGDRKYKIAGVVRGYRQTNAKTIINGQAVDTPLLVNSGIMMGYSIEHAIDAIKKDAEQSQPAN